MARKSRFALLVGSLLFLLVGTGITATSLVAVYSSRAAYDAALLLPLITEFDSATGQAKQVSPPSELSNTVR